MKAKKGFPFSLPHLEAGNAVLPRARVSREFESDGRIKVRSSFLFTNINIKKYTLFSTVLRPFSPRNGPEERKVALGRLEMNLQLLVIIDFGLIVAWKKTLKAKKCPHFLRSHVGTS